MAEQVEGALTRCSECGAALCIRKQVINLAMGNVDTAFCLNCLAKIERETPESIISGLAGYIMGRDCFRKEWLRYRSVRDCPEPTTCIPQTCFNKSDEQAQS
jgi:hypothetical protein